MNKILSIVWKSVVGATILLTTLRTNDVCGRVKTRTNPSGGSSMSNVYKLDKRGYTTGVNKVFKMEPLVKALNSVSTKAGATVRSQSFTRSGDAKSSSSKGLSVGERRQPK